MQLKIKLLNSSARFPTYAHTTDAGFDLYAALDSSVEISPGGRILVPTGLAMEIPESFVGLVCPRSGNAVKQGVTVLNAPGVVDSGYRGEVKVLLINHNSSLVIISPGDRIAQMLITPVVVAELTPVNSLQSSDRGTGGFGSTGT